MGFLNKPMVVAVKFEQDEAESDCGSETLEVICNPVPCEKSLPDGNPDRYWTIKTGPEGWSFNNLNEICDILRRAGVLNESEMEPAK